VTPTIIAAGLVGGISSPVCLAGFWSGDGGAGVLSDHRRVTVVTALVALMLLRRVSAEARG
jgi:MFS transporter, FHS family, glucose/mannose:H+ symporter